MYPIFKDRFWFVPITGGKNLHKIKIKKKKWAVQMLLRLKESHCPLIL